MRKRQVYFTIIALIIFYILRISIRAHHLNKPLEIIASQKHTCDSLSSAWSMKNYQSMPDSICQEFKKACHLENCNQMMDIVILWVDGSDPELQKKKKVEKQRFFGSLLADKETTIDDGDYDSRFRDLGQFRYALRSIEQNFPIYRRIFIVTNNQYPKWLNLSHPRIRLIDHSVLKPSRNNQLFNSMAIQSMIHTIPTLSSPFYYMEDDMVFSQKVELHQLFDNEGRCINVQTTHVRNINETGIIDGTDPSNYESTLLNAIRMAQSKNLNLTYFFKGDNTLRFSSHISKCLFAEDFAYLWNTWQVEMLEMSRRSFRSSLDPHFWILYFSQDGEQKKNSFDQPRSHSFFLLTGMRSITKLINNFQENPVTFLCVNDDFEENPTAEEMKALDDFYLTLTPSRASFEKYE